MQHGSFDFGSASLCSTNKDNVHLGIPLNKDFLVTCRPSPIHRTGEQLLKYLLMSNTVFFSFAAPFVIFQKILNRPGTYLTSCMCIWLQPFHELCYYRMLFLVGFGFGMDKIKTNNTYIYLGLYFCQSIIIVLYEYIFNTLEVKYR